MSKSILVIGGVGYIGSVVVKRLLSAGHRVTCLDLLLYENHTCVLPYLDDPGFRFLYGDFADSRTLSQALEDVTDVVLLAGLVGDPITKKYPQESAAINDEGMRRCIAALHGAGLDRVVFVSTCSNYGLIDSDELADETFPLNPLSLYAQSKVAAEQHILSGRGVVDYTPTVLRFATAFGLAPRMRFDLTVNEFTRELALGRELSVYDAETWRPYCHVRDFARLIGIVLEATEPDVAFEVFNAGGARNNFTKRGIVETIQEFLPEARIRYQEQGSDPRNYRVDFSKVRTTLGFEPEYSVEMGAREILAAISERVFDRVEAMPNYYGNYEVEYPCC